MILGTGIDILEIPRLAAVLERHPESLLRRLLTERERRVAATRADALPYYAGRWAAKEAVVKALGVGVGSRCGFQDIEIDNDALGRPTVTLSGVGAETAASLGVAHIHLSISHEQHYACAMAIAESAT
jgi:holo-[acyl-carrier protein] synthase